MKLDKKYFKPREKSELGLDAGKAAQGKSNDTDFYDWIKGGESGEGVLASIAEWLLEELREKQDVKEVQNILSDWMKNCEQEEFKTRLAALDRLMPPHHPYHKVKGDFLPN